ncbi:Undecaprenyl diphosphate synthase [Tuber magnatum]|uniref:ditrans,polycis-polyprenyl diphosphate synthase [(2E,6E)-farnesyldiphosphate specific] n=1 Tax=Tuber magnatum TaxID=42249 RepID=A0A317SRW8_9PEZI|nr:Undecaprenyl diphosphate synthase [Tuber magnatum]
MANASPPPPPYSSSSSSAYPPRPLKSALRSRQQKPPEVLERERALLARLPAADLSREKPIRNFLATRFYKFVLLTIHLLFGIYLKLRWAYHNILNRGLSILYYHHRTPQLIRKDVKELEERGKLPEHVSVILEYERGGLDTLIDEVSEISCWCASAGIKTLSVYEQTGILKSYISTSHRSISQRLHSYFGRSRPRLRVHAPPLSSLHEPGGEGREVDLEVIFISEEDGRESLVDLTKTLCDMAQRGKIASEDVSVELIDAEVTENTISEPDLLILFSPSVVLRGYPPWQIRLTEIFHVQDNSGVGYQVFLRALHRFAKTEMRFGR